MIPSCEQPMSQFYLSTHGGYVYLVEWDFDAPIPWGYHRKDLTTDFEKVNYEFHPKTDQTRTEM